ncbi:uncharacterized protein LOC6528973 [Drosophila yakuba]|uniref:Gamma tubulin complex component C-terminal domain-containing protein n=1 Tax=Drosophila yakuba TaxID=7245 RepID=B4NY81_DROYA|nr:uncharacterized protein LOC6528973 [Drosophila yakuba]EDW89717.1 uncharacterized protein Dyak_GE21144 [Drosophila yakuba]
MEIQPIKIALDEEMAGFFKQPPGEDGSTEAYDLHMGILELSVSLGNFTHDVEKSVHFIAESNKPLNSSFELVFLNDFRMQFERLQRGKDPEERTLHETRGDLFMRLYKELVDIEPDEIQRCEYLKLFYDLFDSVQPKLNGLQEPFTYRMELIDRMHGQVQSILERLGRTPDAKEISSDSEMNIYLESKRFRNEVNTQSLPMIVGLNKEICYQDKELKLRNVHHEILHVEGYRLIESYTKIISFPLMGIRIDDGFTVVTYKKERSEPRDTSAKPKTFKNGLKVEMISPNFHENNISIASEYLANISFIDQVLLAVYDYINCEETASSMGPVENSIRILDSCSDNHFVLVSSAVCNEKVLKSANEHAMYTKEELYDGTDKMNDTFPKEIEVSKSCLAKDESLDRRDVENIIPFTFEQNLIGHKTISFSMSCVDKHVVSCRVKKNISGNASYSTFTDDLKKKNDYCDPSNISEKSKSRTSINSEFKLYDSNISPKSAQPLPYNTSATCSMNSLYKGAFKIPIGVHSCKSSQAALKNITGKLFVNKFDKHTQSNLKKMKDLFVDYKNKLVAMNEVVEKQMLATEIKCQAFFESEEMDATVLSKPEDQSLNQLRQAVSDIKINILKEVDKSLELTLYNSSHILLKKPSKESTKNETKNYGRNSRFTDGLRLQYPRALSRVTCRPCKSNNTPVSTKKATSNLCPRKKIDKSLPKSYKNNQAVALHKKVVKCDNDPNDINCKNSPFVKSALRLKATPVISEQYLAREDSETMIEPIISEIKQSVGEFKQSVIKVEDSNCLHVESSRNEDIADLFADPKDLSLSTQNLNIDICEECCDPDNFEKISPILSRVKVNVLNEKDNVYMFKDRKSRQKICSDWVENSDELSSSSCKLRIDVCTEGCDLRNNTENLNEFGVEENISPALSQITQTSNLVRQQVLKKMDKLLSDISGINIPIKNEEDSLMLDERRSGGSKELNPSSCNLSTNILEGFSDISQRLTSGHQPDDQDKLSPILGQITKTVSNVKINILNEVVKSLSEITLRSVSAVLQNRKSNEYLSKQQQNQELNYTTDDGTLFGLSEENVVKVNPLKNVESSLSKSTLKNPSDAILGKPLSRNVKHMSETSELCECSETQLSSKNSNQILYLCKNCSVKVNYSKEEDKYIAEGFSINKRKCKVTERNDWITYKATSAEWCRKPRPKWHHQRYVIAAPRVIVKSFKSNPAYEWPPEDPNGPDLYEQLDQFIEITGQKKYCADGDLITASIQHRLSQVLKRIIRKAPKDMNFPDLMTIVGKAKLEQLLTRKEQTAYDSLRWQSRDKGNHDLSAEGLFTDALHGMMGYGSPHLKVSPLTGRLLLRSPQHQKNISESYLLLTIGYLGYCYRELKEHHVMLAEQGETAVALGKCLQKYLLNFHQFYDVQKRNPCSLLALYRRTRNFQWQFEWLLEVFNNVQKAKSVVVSLYEESSRRIGFQRNLLLKWLRVIIQPFIFNLHQWLRNGRLPSTNLDKFLIEQTKSLKIDEFWQKRYRITEFFCGIFDLQLNEILISVGKTLEYSDKYLSINLETCLPRNELRSMLFETLDQFFRHGDQEPLYHFVRKLHLEVSSKVLKQLRKIRTNPEHLFSELHKYIMLSDLKFTNEFLYMFEPILGDTESSFNIRLFNEMKDKILHNPVPDIYIDKSQSEGSRCWSMLILRWKMPVHWKALLGGESKEYEAIFTAMWRFHYVYYVLCERIHRQQMQFRNRIAFKSFEDLNDTFKCFSKLINACMRLMNVLREYFLDYLLEPAFARLLLACKHANTVDQLLDANRQYLRTIMLGSLQTKNLRKPHQYLERLYDLILKLDDKQQKFLRLSQISVDYVIKVRVNKPQSIVSNYYRERILQFRWTCQNYSDVINEMRDQFDSAMISFLFSLHLADEDSLRRLAKRLDPERYYMEKDNRLGLVQFFEFRRKNKKSPKTTYIV